MSNDFDEEGMPPSDSARRPRIFQGKWSRKIVASYGEMKVKGYGLFVYGGMMMLGGGMLALGHPVFILVAAPGLLAFLLGLHTLVQRARRKRAARRHVRNDKR